MNFDASDLKDQIGYLLTGPLLEICQLRAALREQGARIAEQDAEIERLRNAQAAMAGPVPPSAMPPLHVVPQESSRKSSPGTPTRRVEPAGRD